jgi:hypothetical protein
MRRTVFFLSSLLAYALCAAPAFAQDSEPAGGAALGEVAAATGGAVVFTTALLVLGLGHRSGRVKLLGRWAAFSERVSGLPGWAALPSGIASVSLIVAVFGMYWDISLHIDVGRDSGPLANPAHWLILVGLFGIFAAGFFSMVLPRERPGASAVRIVGDWYAPMGGALMCACGAFALAGFPLDDLWHRLFGQDVTLWGPTHLMLIGGASMTLIGIAVLTVEGDRARPGDGPGAGQALAWTLWARRVALTGAFMLGLSTFQAEFDFGVPQFRFVFQPMLIMLAAGVGLVATRLWLGRGSALGAVAFFLAMRGLLSLFVGPIAGQTTPHFPLYVGAAVIVELVALRVSTDRPLRFGAVCGVLIGTVGLASEWAWSHVWMPLPWPSELLPEAAVLGLAVAIGASLIGAWVGARLASDRLPRTRSLRAAAVLGAIAVAASVAYGLNKPADEGVVAEVALTEVRGAPDREVNAEVRIRPASAADGAEWVTVTAWQGGGLKVDRLREVAPGQYRSTEPIPVHGTWKAMVRLHRGRSLLAAPIFLPRDTAIPAAEVPARPQMTRPMVSDHEVLQREQRTTAGWLPYAGYTVVLAISLALLALIVWGLHRIATTSGGPPPASRRRGGAGRLRRRSPGKAATPA